MSETLTQKLSRVWTGLVYRYPGTIFMAVLAFTVLCGWYASGLQLRTDFKELLPKSSQAVRDYDRYRERVGGTGNFVIVIENKNFEKARQYVDAVVAALNAQVPPGIIRHIDYKVTAQKKFLEENKYLFVSVDDLNRVHDRLKTKLEWEIKCKNPAYFDLEGECEKDPGFDFSDIEKNYSGSGRKYSKYRDDYYTSAEGDLMAILVKPSGDGAKVQEVAKFLKTVDPVIRSVDPAKFDPSIHIQYTGAFTGPYEEYKIMRHDISSTALLCTVLILASLVIYYRRFRTIYFIFAGAIFGLTWMFALTMATYGFLNSVSAFLGTIVLGNGINNAIIYVARYLEERRGGKDLRDALEIAMATTFRATFVAAFTTAAAYAALYLSHMQGHRQFGVIGSFGMAACWLATYLALPPLICLVEKVKPIDAEEFREEKLHIGDRIYSMIQGKPVAWLASGAIVTLAGAICLVLFLKDPWEEDFTKIRSASSVKSGHQHANRMIMDRIFDLSLTPAVILLDDPKDGAAVTAALEKIRAQPDSIIDAVRYSGNILPDRQEEKIEILGRIRKLLEGQALKFLTADQQKEVERIKNSFSLKPVALADIPDEVVRNFRERDGSLDKLVYVFPNNKRELSQKKNLEAFVAATREIRLPDGRMITSASEQTLVLDTINLTIETAPKVILLSYVAVFLLVWMTFPTIRATLTLMLSLSTALIMIFVGFYGLEEKLTFFNFIALPLTMGIGIDYGTNIYNRYELDGHGSIKELLRTTGGAVLLCSLTTLIGYVSLLIANNQMLVYFGWLCLIGEVTTVVTAVVLLPAYLLWRERKVTSISSARD